MRSGPKTALRNFQTQPALYHLLPRHQIGLAAEILKADDVTWHTSGITHPAPMEDCKGICLRPFEENFQVFRGQSKVLCQTSWLNLQDTSAEKALRNRNLQPPPRDPLLLSLWWDLGISHFKSALNALICNHHTNSGWRHLEEDSRDLYKEQM